MTRSERIKQLVNRSLYLMRQLEAVKIHLDKVMLAYDEYRQQHKKISTDAIDNISAQINIFERFCTDLQSESYRVEKLEYHTRSQVASILKDIRLTDTTIEVSDRVTILPLSDYHTAVTIVVKD